MYTKAACGKGIYSGGSTKYTNSTRNYTNFLKFSDLTIYKRN